MTDHLAPRNIDYCESCGDQSDDLVTVRRLYLAAGVSPLEADGAIATGGDDVLERVEGTERWCFPCRTMYPHETVVDA
jgi:hypothetical protein